MKYAKERGLLNVVYDQIGTPTYARDLAQTILEILPSAVKSTASKSFIIRMKELQAGTILPKQLLSLQELTAR